MDVQFNENKLIELYCEVDDLYQAFMNYLKKKGKSPKKSPGPQASLNASEVCTILVGYHYSGYKTFEYYYHQIILKTHHHCFPDAPSYERFVQYIPRAIDLTALWLIYTTSQSKQTGLYFIDSKKLEVCHLKREYSNKVFKGLAQKGKTSTGYFWGLKIHLVINNLGEIVSFALTPGNVSDNNKKLLTILLNRLKGICVGDKGYLTSLFDFFFENDLQMITKPRKNMKKRPIKPEHNILINKRPVIESVFDILMTICDIEHSRHRSAGNAIVHIFSSLIAYQHLDQKPRVFFPSVTRKMKLAA